MDSRLQPDRAKQYASIAADVDLVADLGVPSLRIRAVVAGNLNLAFANNTTAIVPILAGETLVISAVKILTTSTTATGITVFA